MKVKFCPPPDSPLAVYAGVIGDVIPGSLTMTRLSFTFEAAAIKRPYLAQISAVWEHVELVSG